MFDWIRQRVLRFMRVPPAPEPPLGAPDSVRIFRAGRNYYKLRLARWGLGQMAAAFGLSCSLVFFWWFKGEVEAGRRASLTLAPAAPAASPAPVAPPPPAKPVPIDNSPAGKAAATDRKVRLMRINMFKAVAKKTTPWEFIAFEIFELGGVLLFLAQLPISFAAVRLEFELHWYIVTDRSLRIRTGLVRLQESTMSFANLQQVEVKQGPLQRLLGLADVHVQSAGGGGIQQPGHEQDSLHTGVFHSVESATEIRDLILKRLRQFRQTGLGDPDDHNHAASATDSAVQAPGDALAAVQEVLAEARALRAALG
jgi:membrane protein YdbS with pleckstrin-like domain